MMSNVQRVCVQCGAGNPVEARYCAACGYDSQSALPAQRLAMPAAIGQAALPVLLGAASMALRFGWKLLQNRLAQPPATKGPTVVTPAQNEAMPQQRRARRSIHIRSSWAVNNGNG